MALAGASACHAQVAGSITAQNAYWSRGYSIGDDRPSVTATASYDDISGLYASASLTGSLNQDDDPALIGVIVNVGHAWRVAPRLSLDGGLTRAAYVFGSRMRASWQQYDEIYAGAVFRGFSAHVHFSPDYFRSGRSTLYGEVSGGVNPVGDLQIIGRVGMLHYVRSPASVPVGDAYDWSFGFVKPVKRLDLSLTVNGAEHPATNYNRTVQRSTRVIGAITWIF